MGTKMQFIKHRVNRIADLATVDQAWGAEIDVRSDPHSRGKMHVTHDPWTLGDDFATWLDEYKSRGIRGPLIVNTKEDGLEESIRKMLTDRGLENFFFLDTALPTLVKWTQKLAERRFAVRLSRYEVLEGIAIFKGVADWVWVDCFDGIPLPIETFREARKLFKVCLVSPELQGMGVETINKFRHLLPELDAICTKVPAEWLGQG